MCTLEVLVVVKTMRRYMLVVYAVAVAINGAEKSKFNVNSRSSL